jgi:hypothetical protein
MPEFSPLPPNKTTGEKYTTLAASTLFSQSVAINPSRRGGDIKNTSNTRLWVKYGAATANPVLTAAVPFREVLAGASLPIPAEYQGVISMIWTTRGGLTGGAIITEMIG